jgi:hypothetical protein
MKKEKLSLNGIKNVLSRTELKNIMAGSSGGGSGTGGSCGTVQLLPPQPFQCHDTTGFVLGTIYSGYCNSNPCGTVLATCKMSFPNTSYATGQC